MNTVSNKTQTVTGMNYFNLASYAFLGLGMEVLYAFVLEPMIYKATMQEWTVSQSILHWIITCITWGAFGYYIVTAAKKKYHFDIFETKGKIKLWQWAATILCILLVLISTYITWDGSKVLKEFTANGMPKFIFQYIYYFFETMLFMLIIVFGQKACEMWFKKANFPYGGIIVALTWGLAHWGTKGSFLTGIFTALCGFFFGAVYLLLNRNIKWTYVALCVMFIL